jgi:hypothetical protein
MLLIDPALALVQLICRTECGSGLPGHVSPF